MTSEVSLASEVVPVPLLCSAEQRFYCAPYKVAMLAKGCVERQAHCRVSEMKRMTFMKCPGCDLGREVEARVGVAELKQHPRHKKRGGWGSPAISPKKKKRALPILQVVDGGRKERVEPTIPTLGDTMPSAQAIRETVEEVAAFTKEIRPMAMTAEEKKLKRREWQKNYWLRRKARESGQPIPPKGTPAAKTIRGGRKLSTSTKPSGDLAEGLTRALEAVRLVEAIGWERVTKLAEMFAEARRDGHR